MNRSLGRSSQVSSCRPDGRCRSWARATGRRIRSYWPTPALLPVCNLKLETRNYTSESESQMAGAAPLQMQACSPPGRAHRAGSFSCWPTPLHRLEIKARLGSKPTRWNPASRLVGFRIQIPDRWRGSLATTTSLRGIVGDNHFTSRDSRDYPAVTWPRGGRTEPLVAVPRRAGAGQLQRRGLWTERRERRLRVSGRANSWFCPCHWRPVWRVESRKRVAPIGE